MNRKRFLTALACLPFVPSAAANPSTFELAKPGQFNANLANNQVFPVRAVKYEDVYPITLPPFGWVDEVPLSYNDHIAAHMGVVANANNRA